MRQEKVQLPTLRNSAYDQKSGEFVHIAHRSVKVEKVSAQNDQRMMQNLSKTGVLNLGLPLLTMGYMIRPNTTRSHPAWIDGGSIIGGQHEQVGFSGYSGRLAGIWIKNQSKTNQNLTNLQNPVELKRATDEN